MTSRILHGYFIALALLAFVHTNAQHSIQRPLNWATKVESCQLENFYKLNDSIYRSEQPDKAEFACLAGTGMLSVLNLRSYHMDSTLIENSSLKPFTVKMKANDFTDNEIIESLRILRSGPKPIVVHCKHGSDRTGVVIAMYRIIFENWTKDQALDELQHGGYGFHEKYTNITGYIKNADTQLIRKNVMN